MARALDRRNLAKADEAMGGRESRLAAMYGAGSAGGIAALEVSTERRKAERRSDP